MVVHFTQPEGTKFRYSPTVKGAYPQHTISICNAKDGLLYSRCLRWKGSGTYDTTKNVE